MSLKGLLQVKKLIKKLTAFTITIYGFCWFSASRSSGRLFQVKKKDTLEFVHLKLKGEIFYPDNH